MIKITLKDGSTMEIEQGSSVYEAALQISEGLARAAVAGAVDGEVVDLTTKLEQDCALEILTFDDERGKKHFGIQPPTFWHRQ